MQVTTLSVGAAAPNSTGTGLTRRAEALDGELDIVSPAGGPTTITMTLLRDGIAALLADHDIAVAATVDNATTSSPRSPSTGRTLRSSGWQARSSYHDQQTQTPR